jgi:predicted cobalt transporter CbtA
MPCPYANLLGEPGKGVHAPRILGLARNDIIATIIVAILSSYIFNISFLYSLLFWVVLGELLHWLAGTQTAGLKALGLTPNCQ